MRAADTSQYSSCESHSFSVMGPSPPQMPPTRQSRPWQWQGTDKGT
jgi:hypothetical protein